MLEEVLVLEGLVGRSVVDFGPERFDQREASQLRCERLLIALERDVVHAHPHHRVSTCVQRFFPVFGLERLLQLFEGIDEERFELAPFCANSLR